MAVPLDRRRGARPPRPPLPPRQGSGASSPPLRAAGAATAAPGVAEVLRDANRFKHLWKDERLGTQEETLKKRGGLALLKLSLELPMCTWKVLNLTAS